jgi:hypothetical protein
MMVSAWAVVRDDSTGPLQEISSKEAQSRPAKMMATRNMAGKVLQKED